MNETTIENIKLVDAIKLLKEKYADDSDPLVQETLEHINAIYILTREALKITEN